MDQSLEKKLAELEAMLFIQGEPLSRKKAQKILGMTSETFDSLLSELEKRLSAGERGLCLLRDEEKIQLATKPQFKTLVESFVKAELSEDLTPASLEVLSLVTYLGPVLRSQIEYRRGVNSSFTLRNLLIRGLVERFSDSEHTGAYLYRPSFEFLKHLGVTKKEELPEYEKFASVLARSDSETPAAEALPQ